jgi:hypothetical protein
LNTNTNPKGTNVNDLSYPPSDTERAERTKAIWYAYGAIDEMKRSGSTAIDTIDAMQFALLFGTTHKVPGPQPTVSWAWSAYLSFHGETEGLTPHRLAARAADLARG